MPMTRATLLVVTLATLGCASRLELATRYAFENVEELRAEAVL